MKEKKQLTTTIFEGLLRAVTCCWLYIYIIPFDFGSKPGDKH